MPFLVGRPRLRPRLVAPMTLALPLEEFSQGKFSPNSWVETLTHAPNMHLILPTAVLVVSPDLAYTLFHTVVYVMYNSTQV